MIAKYPRHDEAMLLPSLARATPRHGVRSECARGDAPRTPPLALRSDVFSEPCREELPPKKIRPPDDDDVRSM
jgi:hypothetical protein